MFKIRSAAEMKPGWFIGRIQVHVINEPERRSIPLEIEINRHGGDMLK